MTSCEKDGSLLRAKVGPAAARLFSLCGRVFRDRQAVTLVEYGLLACMVAIAMIPALNGLENTLVDTMNYVAGDLPNNQFNP